MFMHADYDPLEYKKLESAFLAAQPFVGELFKQYVIVGTFESKDTDKAAPVMYALGNTLECYQGCHRTLDTLSSTLPFGKTLPPTFEDMLKRCYARLDSLCTNTVIIAVIDYNTSVHTVTNPTASNRFTICASLLWAMQRLEKHLQTPS